MIRVIDSKLSIHNCVAPKKWGKEIIIHNGEDYCGKLLVFKEGAKFSMHYHILKKETWYVQEGKFLLKYIDTSNATRHEKEISTGAIVEINRGDPHQLIALTKGIIFEVSTQHFDNDSYRIEGGDSQC
jgi:mannose-6-phosphate isomerase-like protein (cupin superfamily)